MRQVFKVVLPAIVAAVLFLLPNAAYAQTGSISGVARDGSGAALPGVTVEVRSPALIEGVRTVQTDGNGRYQITVLPVGTYTVEFKLQGFNVSKRDNVQLTTDFTANVNGDLKVGDIKETVQVTAEAPLVDVANARVSQTFKGEDLRDLPTSRNVPSLMALVPGISSSGFNGNICSGGVGVFCSPNISNFNSHTSVNDTDGLNQGRLLVNGIPINAANQGLITGQSGGYNADIANAQEITFTMSGSMGESETGGVAINIIPRSGGNRYAGNFFTSYTSLPWFDRNSESRRGALPNLELNDHDVSGSFGGPILKDRLWFYSVARHQGKEATQLNGPFYENLNAGRFADNYSPDIAGGAITYENLYRNINMRLTVQASQKNKFDVFWDEQDSCQDPCMGVVSTYTSPESWWSVQTRPNHLAQLSWTNPLTNKLLLEAGTSGIMQHYDTTKNREWENVRANPRVAECINPSSRRINAFAGTCTFGGFFPFFDTPLTSGSIEGGQVNNIDNWRSRASASYITGAHNAKVGYDNQWYSQKSYNDANDMRLSYLYNTPTVPVAGCNTPTVTTINGIGYTNNFPCGNVSMWHPEDPTNASLQLAVPSNLTMNTGPRTFDERVWTNSLYVQDQWTFQRLTLNGALRYDQARSKYFPTCVGPDNFVPVGYCAPTTETDGVNFQNITPRWGVAWDIFGTGKTAIKWNMGKYLQAAQMGGIYTASNPARRTVNTYTRPWQDWNGNRVPDCYNPTSTNVPDVPIQPGQPVNTPLWARPHANLGDFCGGLPPLFASGDPLRFGLDPYGLDAANLGVSLTTTQCGRDEAAIAQAVKDYCARSGQNLLDGWDNRRAEWQLGIGIQHELLPRLSAEVTYNRRWYYNQQVTDTLGNGCEIYAADQTLNEPCLEGNLNYTNPQYDFFGVTAPVDGRLPDGGGYQVLGMTDRKNVTGQPAVTFGTLQAVTLTTRQAQVWRGVDTNFVLRARGGLRLSGGTSTGSQYTDNCDIQVNAPAVVSAHGGDPSCRINRPFQTNVRANASYTIPKIDVLTSVIFQYRPGVELMATYNFAYTDALWIGDSVARQTGGANTVACPAGNQVPGVTTGCFQTGAGGQLSAFTSSVNLYNAGERYGEGIRLIDLKFAKNIRFANKRVNIGVDVYNLFNSDAALGYDGTYNDLTFVNGAYVSTPHVTQITSGGVTAPWQTFGTVNNITTPRFARFQVQFDF